MTRLHGSCHCGNIKIEAELPKNMESYSPRACDCDFCEKHSAAYVTDPQGKLKVKVRDSQLLRYYHQGDENADFMVCMNCGVLAGVTYQYAGIIYGAINSRIVNERERFAPITKVSPKTLDEESKLKRWKEIWFPNVEMES